MSAAPQDPAGRCPRCGTADGRYTGRYGPMRDGKYVCFPCASRELAAAGRSGDKQ